MRILLLITGLGVGGAERQIVDLADKLISCGHDVLIVALTGLVVVRPISEEIKVELIQMNKTVAGFALAYMRLRKIVKAFLPDVIHSHMVHANLLARLLRLTLRFPKLICTAHSTNEGGRLRMLAYRLTDSLADLSTNVSEEAVAAFVTQGAVAPGRMISVPNGIDTDRFIMDRLAGELIRTQMGAGPNLGIILAVGRLTEAKDYPNLLHAYAVLYISNPKTQLWIVGEGKLRLDLENLANILGLSNCVRFLGVRHDVPSLMSAADVFVLSSAWEGFGLVVAEAMACECVVVATDCGGVQEVLGDAGYLVKPRNSAALEQALQSALELSAIESATLGHAARRRVIERYALNLVAERWLQIYEGKWS